MTAFRVLWDNEAKKELKEIYKRIQISSVTNADLVMERILKRSKSLSTLPNRNPEYSRTNHLGGNIRFFIESAHIVVYEVMEDLLEVHVRRVFHKGQEY